MAVGDYFNGTGSQTLVETYDGSTWAVVPSPNGTASSFGNTLSGVSCTSGTFCVAVGKYSNGTADQTLVETYNGSTWSVVPSPNPSIGNFLANDVLDSVSCTSNTFCVAVGQYDYPVFQTLVETYNGSTWSVVPSPNASNKNILGGVSCTSSAFCVAVGRYFNGTSWQTLVETYNGSTWAVAPSPSPSIVVNELDGVSCASGTSCMAVGNYYDGTSYLTLVETYDGSSWVTVPSPNVPALNNVLSGVSCTSSAFCVAVGYYNNGTGTADQTLVEIYDGSAWSVVPSANTSTSSDNILRGVSCPSSALCVAIGYYSASTGFQTLVEQMSSTPVPTTPTPTRTSTTTPTPTPTATPVPPVVVLVHGIDFTHNADANCGLNGAGSVAGLVSLETLINDPRSMGGHQFSTECLIYKTRNGVGSGANDLAQLIERIKRERHVDKVDIVAHSMGGLVARYYIERLNGGGNVRSLTMLGTPNLGSNAAIPVCAFWSQWWFVLAGQYDQGACDMVPIVSPLLAYLNISPGSHAGVSYDVLTGWLGLNAAEPLPNDCIVSYASASNALAFHTEPFPPSDTQRRVLHMTGTGAIGVASGIIGCGTNGNGETEDPGVQARVSQLLLQSNGFATGGGAFAAVAATPTATPTAIPAAPAASTLASNSGLITSGQTIDLPVTMPPAEPTGTFMFRAPADPSAALAFALLRPGGAPVATTDADVTYATGAGFGGLTETHYTIANPATGTWTMRVAGTTVPPTSWPYDLQVLVPGSISVTASAGAGHFDVGQSIPLSANVAVNATPYAGASVNATITKPDNTTASVALTDAGGGAYTGSFGSTVACGLYQVTVTADGSDSGAPFSRQDRTIAIVGVPGNVILDPCVADHSGDGYTDAQAIAVGKNPLTYCPIMRADINGDGTVDALDLSLLAKKFLTTIPPTSPRLEQNNPPDASIDALDLSIESKLFLQPVTACP